MSDTDRHLLGAAGAEIALSNLTTRFVHANTYTVERDSEGVAQRLSLVLDLVGTDTDDLLDNVLGEIEAQLRLATMATGSSSAGSPVCYRNRVGDASEHRSWPISGGLIERQMVYPSGTEMRIRLVMDVASENGAAYGEPISLTVTGTLTNGAAVVVLDDIEGDLPAPVAVTLTAVSGTPQGYRVGVLPVPAGTVAGDFDHVVDLSQASGASSTTAAGHVGGNYRNRAISSGSVFESIGSANQPAGSQNQGKRHVYLRGYDAPGTPSLSAPTGLTADDVGPTLSGGRTEDATVYDTPTLVGSVQTNSNATGSSSTSINTSINPGTIPAGSLMVAAIQWDADFVTSSGSITIGLPSNWQLYYQRSGSHPAKDAGVWAVAYRANAPSSPGSQSFSVTTGNAGTNRDIQLTLMTFTNVTTGFPFSALTSGALTVLDAGSGQLQTPATSASQMQPNERALAFTRDIANDDGGVTAWSQGWESLHNGVVDIGTFTSENTGTVQATFFGNQTASEGAAVVSIIGSKTPGTNTFDQNIEQAGNLRTGNYGIRVQWVDSDGNISTPTSTTTVAVASDGSRIDGSFNAVGSASYYLLSFSRPQGGVRQIALTDTTFSITDDTVGRILAALPTTSTVTTLASRNRLMVGTNAQRLAPTRTFSLPTTSMHTVRVGTIDLPPIAADSDGDRPDWGIDTQAVSGNPGVSATIRHDALFIFPADSFVSMYAKGTAYGTFIYELRTDGVVMARTEGSGNVGQVVAPSELRVWPGSDVVVMEALGTKHASLEDCFASDLSLTFTAQVTYTPAYRG